MAAAANPAISYQSFAKEIKFRLEQADLLALHLELNKARIESVLGDDVVRDLKSLAYFICGYSFDLSTIKQLDGNAMGIIKAFYYKMKTCNPCDNYNSFYAGVTSLINNLNSNSIAIPKNTMVVVDSKTVFTMNSHDEKSCILIRDYMSNLRKSNSDMYKALLNVCINDKKFNDAFDSPSDDRLSDFGMFLLGSGLSVKDLTDYSKVTKAKVMKLLRKFNDDECEGIEALISDIKNSK
jgi:hypothetical protein